MGTRHPSVALAAVRDASGEPTWWTTRCERQLAGFRHRLFSLVSRLAVSSTGWGGADGIRQPLVDSLHVPDGALLASTSFCAHPDMCATGFWQQKSSRGPTDYLMFLPDGTLSERDEYRHQTENEAYRASSYSAAPQ